jgi:NADPH-dependent glutamate synthase beta subunit-like oxidoreductase
MSRPRSDITLPPDLRQKTGTGPVRLQHPVYIDSIPPCNHACPAGENIQGWLDRAQAGDFEAAWRILVRDNPMPAIHGRVCYHPCESNCNRRQVDDAVSIHAVERFLGDLALQEGWVPEIEAEPSGRKILIVGAGPSGLSAAWHLALMGHQVEIREAGPMAGGMMRFGIPAYRMPRDILDAEVARIEKIGVKIVLDSKVEDILAAKEDGGFDAVFLAIGAHVGKHVDIPARDSGRILDAVSYLGAQAGPPGGRVRRRQHRHGRGAHRQAARRRGGDDHLSPRPRAHAGARIRGHRRGIRGHQDQLAAHHPRDRQHYLPGRGHGSRRGRTAPADRRNRDPGGRCAGAGAGPAEGVFAGGDMVPSDRTVTIATGHGKKAAHHIDAWLRGTAYEKETREPRVLFEDLHLRYYTDAQQRQQAMLPPEHRTSDFREVTAGLDPKEARFEAARCYSCGNCFECDGCYGACPEDAIARLGRGKGYEIDYDLCTGCQACVLQCPCNAMEMVSPEVAV